MQSGVAQFCPANTRGGLGCGEKGRKSPHLGWANDVGSRAGRCNLLRQHGARLSAHLLQILGIPPRTHATRIVGVKDLVALLQLDVGAVARDDDGAAALSRAHLGASQWLGLLVFVQRTGGGGGRGEVIIVLCREAGWRRRVLGGGNGCGGRGHGGRLRVGRLRVFVFRALRRCRSRHTHCSPSLGDEGAVGVVRTGEGAVINWWCSGRLWSSGGRVLAGGGGEEQNSRGGRCWLVARALLGTLLGLKWDQWCGPPPLE